MNKIELKHGVNLHYIKTNIFKTNLICVMLTVPLKNETVTENALIPFLLKRGTSENPNYIDISKKLDSLYGTSFNCGVDKIGDNQLLKFYVESIRDEFTINQEKITKQAINLLFEIIFSPYLENGFFKEEFLKTEKEKLKQIIESKIDNKDMYALEKCINYMYKNEGYGIYKYGTIEEIQKITKESITECYFNLIKNAKIDIYASGRMDEDELIKIIKENKHFKNLPDREENIIINNEYTENKQNVDKYIEKVENMNITQGKLVIGLDILSKQNKLKFVGMVYNAILGDGANSMLFQNVREKASLAYSARSVFVRPKMNIFIRCGIEIDNYERAVDIIKQQLNNIKNGNFSENDIQNAKEYLISGMKSISEEQDSEIVFYIGQETSKSNDSIKTYITEIESVSKEQIIEFANNIQINTIFFLKN